MDFCKFVYEYRFFIFCAACIISYFAVLIFNYFENRKDGRG